MWGTRVVGVVIAVPPMEGTGAGPDATVVTLPGPGRPMPPSPTGAVTGHGGTSTTIARGALDPVTSWLRERF